MSQHSIPTVKIKHKGSASGFAVINAADYDPSIHEMHTDVSARTNRRSDADIIEDAAAEARARIDEEARLAAEKREAEKLPSDVARDTGDPLLHDLTDQKAFDQQFDADLQRIGGRTQS
jgi:hypothetical protein